LPENRSEKFVFGFLTIFIRAVEGITALFCPLNFAAFFWLQAKPLPQRLKTPAK